MGQNLNLNRIRNRAKFKFEHISKKTIKSQSKQNKETTKTRQTRKKTNKSLTRYLASEKQKKALMGLGLKSPATRINTRCWVMNRFCAVFPPETVFFLGQNKNIV
jgi:hypothetical protein